MEPERRAEEAPASGREPLVSVIIPCRNEAPTLPLVLDSLLEQELDFPMEVIFADGGSTDESAEVVEKHPLSQKVPVKMLKLPPAQSGRATSKKVGVSQSRGRIILFRQADCRVRDSQALNKVVQAMKAPGVVGTDFTLIHAEKYFHEFDFWGQHYQSFAYGLVVPHTGDTKFNAVSRETFDAMGGYNEKFALAGEDIEFNGRLVKLGRVVDSNVVVEHVHGYGKNFTPLGILKKFCRNAEVSGSVAPAFMKYREQYITQFPAVIRQFLKTVIVTVAALVSFVPALFPWPLLLMMAAGVLWQKKAFLHIRNWRLVLLPFYGLAYMYCYVFFYWRGMIFGKPQ